VSPDPDIKPGDAKLATNATSGEPAAHDAAPSEIATADTGRIQLPSKDKDAG
jgi:hypothetical protein